ncbi:MAG: WYL domain-containing protein [Clostridia bacterium]|nr:WYL domain-containing protein [Clostridia bacterium]
MYTIPPKKMITINILNILRKYSDMDHRLTGQEIMEYLKKDYYMDVDRKTVKRNLMNLTELDYGIDYEEITRTDAKGRESSICTNWYIQREFDDSELRFLIDSLLFARVPSSQCRKLIEKLKGLSNIYFEKKLSHIYTNMAAESVNKELFYTVDVLSEAIEKKKKVSFVYNAYGRDKKLHPRREKLYVVSPYAMVALNGRYYLLCTSDNYDTVGNYRIDRITGITMLNEKAKSNEKLNISEYMAERPYMFTGKSERIRIKIDERVVDQAVDWFGDKIKFEQSSGETFAEVYANREAFFHWALQYGLWVEVLAPADLRNKMVSAIERMRAKYTA